MKYLDPRSQKSEKTFKVPITPSIDGKKLGVLSNGWKSMVEMIKLIEPPLKDIYGVSEVTVHEVARSTAPPEGLLEKMAKNYSAVIVGLAN